MSTTSASTVDHKRESDQELDGFLLQASFDAAAEYARLATKLKLGTDQQLALCACCMVELYSSLLAFSIEAEYRWTF
jgi:hypothetical protein